MNKADSIIGEIDPTKDLCTRCDTYKDKEEFIVRLGGGSTLTEPMCHECRIKESKRIGPTR